MKTMFIGVIIVAIIIMIVLLVLNLVFSIDQQTKSDEQIMENFFEEQAELDEVERQRKIDSMKNTYPGTISDPTLRYQTCVDNVNERYWDDNAPETQWQKSRALSFCK